MYELTHQVFHSIDMLRNPVVLIMLVIRVVCRSLAYAGYSAALARDTGGVGAGLEVATLFAILALTATGCLPHLTSFGSCQSLHNQVGHIQEGIREVELMLMMFTGTFLNRSKPPVT